MMTTSHPFNVFLETFVPKVAAKHKQLNKAIWILETTGCADAADLKAELDTELRLLFNDSETYQRLMAWSQDASLSDPLLKRQLTVLLRAFKHHMIDRRLLEEIAKKEAKLAQIYGNFRPTLEGKTISENDIRDILKQEKEPLRRMHAWNASKEIGQILAPHILELVHLRNQAAKSLGYANYFEMSLALQEVDDKWLFQVFDELASRSDPAYQQMMQEIQKQLARRFNVHSEELGPWAWSDPFCQEDPLEVHELDQLTSNIDLCEVGAQFYQKMGIDVRPILQRSDMHERPGKNQHAFCLNIDRSEDVRTLNNIRPTIKWFEVVLHELGHAIYELGFDRTLPWLLREPPHMLTTEAMALIAGRRAYMQEGLQFLTTTSAQQKNGLMHLAEEGLKRRQLIFSRWVLVMTHFEKELYRDPSQNLNKLWWEFVEKYQGIRKPKRRDEKEDWAAKYHIGLAPVYYYSYLLGEMLASALEKTLAKEQNNKILAQTSAGKFLQQRLFYPGNRMHWMELAEHAVGDKLKSNAWIEQFAKV